ncbi:MAG: alpha/beta hydrolase [Hyphomonadaceae bacterium]|nr:alpha/beta hydrolase [Hyphomonadaceae bacterium]
MRRCSPMGEPMDRRLFLAAAAALAVPGVAGAAAPPRTHRYASTPGVDANLQSLDFYGAGGSDAPLAVFIHGGGWRIGDKANLPHGRQKAAAFNAAGFAFASLNYRLSPAVQHPAHVEDVAAGIAWLHANARRLGFDRDRIVVMGHSAGAHLAALVATDARRLGRHGLTPAVLRGAVLLDGAGYDVAAQARATIARGGFAGAMYADAFGRDGALWADASPVTHVAPGKGVPPFLIVHTDRIDATRQSTLLASRLRAAGVDAQLFLARGYTHAAVNRRFGEPGEAVTGAVFGALRSWM